MKKFLSTILAVVMVLSSMAIVVSAEDALADGIYVGTTMYDSIAAAQTAAVASNNEIIISGTVEFGYRQAISADGIHLRGINDAKIIPSASYASGSATNIKGLLNIQADNVKVTDITFDGSVYGSTISSSTDFIVLRINSGNDIILDGVTVKGSPKTLVSVGLEDGTAANVTASNFYAEGMTKTISTSATYADLNVENGSFVVTSGTVDAFAKADNGTLTIVPAGHYSFTYGSDVIKTTAKHIADSYNNSSINWMNVIGYLEALTDNDPVTTQMMTDVYNCTYTSSAVKADMLTMINDMLSKTFLNSYKTNLNNYKSILENGPANN